MEHMEAVRRQLELLGHPSGDVHFIQEEKDVLVARVPGPAVIKVYLAREYSREIENYRLLGELGISTLRVLGSTECALLLEDIDVSPSLRLGRPEDLRDPEVGALIAGWYKRLHDRSREYLTEHSDVKLYRETDALTLENMRMVRERTGTAGLPVWALLEERLPKLRRAVESLAPTLNYNDFYYTNLIIARDRSSAMMYDYDLLGRGYAFADVRNVCASLEPGAREVFLQEYGDADPREKLVDDVVCPLCTLCLAFEQESFPGWARSSLEYLKGGLRESLERLLAQEM